jgi:lysophospholipase L1-like esterase
MLKAAEVKVGILNLGRNGATTREVLGQVQTAVQKKPHLLTLGVGANDLWKMVPVGTFEMNLKLIADRLETTGAEIVVTNIVDLSLAPIAAMVDAVLRIPQPVFHKRLDEMNARIAALARRPRFTVIDICAVSRRELRDHPEYFGPDGFHPSAAGYARWAELLWPKVHAVSREWQSKQATVAVV